ncbi:hypothetical protein [Actinophytocola algeriensis]|uniref:DUF4352 domain-containing protein n=1 Tax=Actinophytocola algeriensis TaxID=1768010 RepID=A0A7W7VFG7_9PSEU|nr:hypothetical protein [Actinophytocola algeriensis]MBB4908307.1 hypothetical protein [Actinophytocola algeriensis]MBE1480337.1 hypothetical protein [Actinophytocola algeriensis]
MRRALVLLAAGLFLTACGTDTEGRPTAAAGQKTSEPTTTSRAPFDGEVLGTGEVVRADKLDGIRLESPEDGAVRSYGVAAEVLDFGTADVVDTGDGVQYGAADDATLLAFRLRVTPFAEDLSQKVTATVSVDGRQRSLPDFEYAVGTPGEDQTVQYLVGVPNDRREVELELKYAGLAQQFDLLEGRRTGEQPGILYRSPDEPSVYVENLTPAKLPVVDEDDEPGNYVVAVTRAELTYFTTELGDVPGADDKAWLVVTYEPTGDGSIDTSFPTGCVLPFASFALTADGETYPVVDKHSEMEEFEQEKVLVFEVPSGLTTATLTVKAQPFSCLYGGDDYPYRPTGEAAVEITLPED